MNKKTVKLGLSSKHIHITKEDCDTLFGVGYELNRFKWMGQPGQFATVEKVDIIGPKGTLKGVRIIGPVRPECQLEISISDTYKLGIDAIVKDSGDIEGTPGFTIVGPKGEVVKEKGAIVAARHVHLSTEEGREYGLSDGELASVLIPGKRSIILNNCTVRVGDSHKKEMHIDVEEGNAAGAKNDQLGIILSQDDVINGDMVEVFFKSFE